MGKKKVLALIIAAIVLVGGGIAFYYWDEGIHYVSTKDARIAAAIVSVSPQIPGKLISWQVHEGDMVKAGQNLGWQDTGSVASSAGVSTAALGQVGSITVDKAAITAPIAGEVIKSAAEPGQMVGPGQSLAVIADTEDMYVSANIEETSISKVKVGQEVEISVDALAGRKVMGQVEEIGKATVSTFSVLPTQSSNGNFTKITQLIPVKIRFPGINQLGLLPGMSVEVKIHIAGN